MKRIVFSLGLLIALQSALFAQLTDQEVVVFQAHLWKTFNLNVDGEIQSITFDDAAEYNFGVTEDNGITPGFTLISVEATGNWDLTITAPDFQPYTGGPIGPGTLSIPITNLGVWCEATGTHQFGGEVTCSYTSDVSALGLTDNVTEPDLLIGLGSGNAGDISDNSFTLHWLMGTMQGSMLTTSMFDQLSAGVFGPGDYTTTATLTLTEIP